MDTLLFPKRPCNGIHAPPETLNPTVTDMDALLNTIRGLSDPLLASSLDLSLERLLDSTSSDPEKNQMIDAVLRFGSALQESARKSTRKRACLHNSISWPLPPDLTVKVFSALDMQSLCHAAATCSMFNKCAMDPLCYANIDLTSILSKVNYTVVLTMIERAEKNLHEGVWGICYELSIAGFDKKSMDSNNWRPPQGEPNMDGGDWRTQLMPESRPRIVNKIMETLKRHLPISGPEGLAELRKIAVRFEEKIYTAATSQLDYLRKIPLKMLTMETKSQGGVSNALPSIAGGNQNPSDPAS